MRCMCSWRHTPFRNFIRSNIGSKASSWRHTPFRKIPYTAYLFDKGSWRHTPFRKQYQQLIHIFVCSWRHTPFRNASSLCALLANSGNSVTLSANSDGKTVIYKSLNNDQQFINETITWDDIWDFLSTSLFSRIV